MKPFKINRNSWHYKLNRMTEPNGDYNWHMERWETKHSNFCAYWRVTVFKMLFLSLIASGVIAFIVLTGMFAVTHTISFLITLSVIATLILLMIGFVTVKKRIRANSEGRPESLFVQRYRAQKSKICPVVEFTE